MFDVFYLIVDCIFYPTDKKYQNMILVRERKIKEIHGRALALPGLGFLEK